MRDTLTPDEFRQELTQDPFFFIDFILMNQPDLVMLNMKQKGLVFTSEEGANKILHKLFIDGNKSLVRDVLNVPIDFDKVHVMYHEVLHELKN